MTPPIGVCFTIPDEVANNSGTFNQLSVLHSESGVLIDRTSSRDFANRQVCATVNSLGTFAVAFQVDSNLPAISGLIVDPNGATLSGVIVNLSGNDSRTTQTDSNGVFKFVNLAAGGNYNVQPKDSGVIFVQPSEDVINLNGEQALIFTATPAMFEVSGHVQDAQANALEGVEITIEGFAPTVTDSSGNYSFTNIPAVVRILFLLSPTTLHLVTQH